MDRNPGSRFSDGRRSRRPARYARTALTGLAAAACVLALPVAAQASAPPLPSSSGAALCDGVSPSSVSSVVGWSVPAPTATVKKATFNKKLHISSQDTICTYGTPTSLASLDHEIFMTYDQLSAAPPKGATVASIKSELNKSIATLPAKMHASYSVSTSNGVLAVYGKVSGSIDGVAFAAQFLFNWAGTKVAGIELYGNEAMSTLQSLEKLADNNIGLS